MHLPAAAPLFWGVLCQEKRLILSRKEARGVQNTFTAPVSSVQCRVEGRVVSGKEGEVGVLLEEPPILARGKRPVNEKGERDFFKG